MEFRQQRKPRAEKWTGRAELFSPVHRSGPDTEGSRSMQIANPNVTL